MSRRPVAVTGAAGFVGAHVLRRLAGRGFAVRAGDEPRCQRWHVEDVDAQWYELQMDRPAAVRRFVQGAAAVVHCDCYTPDRALQVRRAKRRGVRRIRRLLEACRRGQVGRVVVLSSPVTMVGPGRTEEGQARRQPLEETSRYVPGSVDSALFEAKAAMEAEVYRYISQGLDVVVAIPTVAVGPGDVHNKVGCWVRALVERRLFAVPEGAMVNVVDVRDVADGVVAALERGTSGRRYALGGANLEARQLFERLARQAQTTPPRRGLEVSSAHRLARLVERIAGRLAPERVPPLLSMTESLRRVGAVSNERACGELNFQPRAVSTTLEDTIEWMARVGYLSWSARSGATSEESAGG